MFCWNLKIKIRNSFKYYVRNRNRKWIQNLIGSLITLPPACWKSTKLTPVMGSPSLVTEPDVSYPDTTRLFGSITMFPFLTFTEVCFLARCHLKQNVQWFSLTKSSKFSVFLKYIQTNILYLSNFSNVIIWNSNMFINSCYELEKQSSIMKLF